MGMVLFMLAVLVLGTAAWIGWGGASEAELRRGGVFVGLSLLMLLGTTALVVSLQRPDPEPSGWSRGSGLQPVAEATRIR